MSSRDLKCISSILSATTRADRYHLPDGDVTLTLRYQLRTMNGRDVWCLVSSQIGSRYAID
jgi:hypothetical protein